MYDKTTGIWIERGTKDKRELFLLDGFNEIARRAEFRGRTLIICKLF